MSICLCLCVYISACFHHIHGFFFLSSSVRFQFFLWNYNKNNSNINTTTRTTFSSNNSKIKHKANLRKRDTRVKVRNKARARRITTFKNIKVRLKELFLHLYILFEHWDYKHCIYDVFYITTQYMHDTYMYIIYALCMRANFRQSIKLRVVPHHLSHLCKYEFSTLSFSISACLFAPFILHNLNWTNPIFCRSVLFWFLLFCWERRVGCSSVS